MTCRQHRQRIDDEEPQRLGDRSNSVLVSRVRIQADHLLARRQHDNADREAVRDGQLPQLPKLLLHPVPRRVQLGRVSSFENVELHREPRHSPFALLGEAAQRPADRVGRSTLAKLNAPPRRRHWVHLQYPARISAGRRHGRPALAVFQGVRNVVRIQSHQHEIRLESRHVSAQQGDLLTRVVPGDRDVHHVQVDSRLFRAKQLLGLCAECVLIVHAEPERHGVADCHDSKPAWRFGRRRIWTAEPQRIGRDEPVVDPAALIRQRDIPDLWIEAVLDLRLSSGIGRRRKRGARRQFARHQSK